MVKDISKKLQAAIAKSATLDPVKGDWHKVQASHDCPQNSTVRWH